ncbi:hypothetical protein C8034_v007856 [Colletotrichum sidae]|uniref:Uncharacterized protein n=3 Tax=Colletotrichum orbiculare species complex TaxID=2707354 RepID=A0A4R8QCJ9_COLTR|nr:hypothetical protein CTRI78_v011299 [Colletotrichum trifolii]TDZ38545.1 hypothetical protein C8035_v004780 [Colletotrichum spinosum]TEA11265.1 hypothetical protein C8034_v007856 [Colletotrichum sidae]
MVNQPARIPTTTPALARFLPAAITVGIVSAVAVNIRSQLKTESATMDRFFAKYKDPQSEAARQRVFEGAMEDPRKSWFNILGW